ncbi:ABC transporter permease [Marinicella sp. W31]|uniref:ABC transporter permease n=1 Tax=Marinicella sp. W31 TaxID=3023713 RepID=UPI0037568A61
MKSPFFVVMMKEIVENLRDTRTLLSSIVTGALLGPVIFTVMINVVVGMQQDKAQSALEMPVQNIAGAKSFKTFLEQQGVELIEVGGSAEEIIQKKEHDAVLRIGDNYAEDFAAGNPAKVELYYDRSAKGAANVTVRRIRGLVNQYSQSIGATRLQLRGISPSITQAVVIENHDTSTSQSRGAQMMAFLPYILMLGLFMGSTYLAIDTTAGEKERNSLEPLLLNPAKRSKILSGKLAATFMFGALTLVLTLIAFVVSKNYLPMDELGMKLVLGIKQVSVLLLVLLPVALLASALQTIVATFSKTFREAQTYVNLLIFIPMIPSIALMILPIKEKLWMMAVPILGQNVVINQLIRGESIDPIGLVLVVLSTLLVGLLLAWVAVRLYNRESLLFSD